MAIKRPDIYEHNNPNLPIADSDFVRGGIRSAVQNLSDLYALTGNIEQLKQHSTQIYVSGENKIYLLKDINNIGNSNGWEEFNFGGGEGSLTNVVYTTGNQNISGVKTFVNNFNITGSGIIANVTSGALLQFSGRNVLTRPDLEQSFRNVYISDTIGNNIDGQIGNINRPYKTAQQAWDAIVTDGLYTNNRSYILNFYEGSYSVIVTNNWPSRVGIRGLGPGNITLDVTHTSLFASQGDGYNFDIKDWGYQSVNLSITSQGGFWAGGLPQNGGNGGNITLYNCRFSTISSRGGNSSSSAFLAGTYGSIYLENCVGDIISLVNGTPSPLKINTSAQTIISSKISAINTQSNTSNITIRLIDSELTSSFPTIDVFNTNRIIKNTRISSSTPSQEKYYFDYQIVSGNRVIKNLELTNSGIFSGDLTGIILTDNITGRNKLEYRNNAFVADFASGIYFSPFVESPNLVYNTGDQSISGAKTFAIRPIVNGTGVLLIGEAAQVDLSNYATVTNLASTGSTLQGQINNLGNTYATVTNLASTGSTLQARINSLSGVAVQSNGTITRMIRLTQAEYNALSPKDPTTFYVIVG